MEAPTHEALNAVERELGVLIHRVRRRTVENARDIDPELPSAAYPILRFVYDHDGVRASQVAEHFGIDKGAVSRQVAQMERLGLVERSSDPADRRAQTLLVTAEGRRRVAELRAARRSAFAGKLAAWTADELADLAEQLHRYNESLGGE